MIKIITKILIATLMIALCTSLMQAQTFTLMDTTYVGQDTLIRLGISAAGGLTGAAWFDYNYDGYLDVCISPGAVTRLWKNDLHGVSQRFIKVSKDLLNEPTEGVLIDTGTERTTWAMLHGYFDADTLIDLVLSNGGIFDLYLNQGPPNFHLVRKEGAFNFTFGFNPLSASVLDVDQDGDLDIVQVGADNRVQPTYIYLNDGTGTFVEDADAIIVGTKPRMECWANLTFDYNNDGYTDLFLGNMYRNLQSPSFLCMGDGSQLIVTDPAETGMIVDSGVISACFGDYDNDGDMDLWTSYFQAYGGHDGYSYLLRNNGDGTFTDVREEAGIVEATHYASRGADWADFDNDGWLDLYVGSRNDNEQRLYRNNGDGTFTEISEAAGARVAPARDMSRKLTAIDWNNDGWVDIYASGQGEPILLQNNGGSNRWIQFIASPAEGSTNRVITSRITISANDLPDQIRDFQSCIGNGSSGQIRAHFGLGSNTVVNSVKIRWSNNVEEGPYTTDISGNPISANVIYTIKEGVGVYPFVPWQGPGGVNENSTRPSGYSLRQNYPNPFNPTTKIQFTLPVRNNVRLDVINTLGQVVKQVKNEVFDAGTHTIEFNASGLASGVYFYKLQAGNFTEVKKMVVLK